MKIQLRATTKKGKFRVTERNYLERVLRSFPEKDLIVTIEKRKKRRSNQQNGYYWACVVTMVRDALIELGNEVTATDVHDFLKMKFLSKEIVMPDGEIVQGFPTTATLSTSEMMDYMAKIQRWASEILNIYIPDPNEQKELFK